MTGCGTKIENAYDTYSTDYINGYNGSNYFASNLCVTNDVNFGQDNMQFAKTAEGAGAFNIDTHQVLYSQNLFEKLYPASTTKILTAYIILKNCDLNATVTVSHDAANPGHSSSVCGLKEGDVITVQDLLYGLLLESGNDAAIALAEYCSGSVEEFAKLIEHVTGMEQRLLEATEELKAVRQEMQGLQNHSLKDALQKSCKAMETNISVMRHRLSELKGQIINGCRNILADFRERGAVALNGITQFLHVRPALESIQNAAEKSMQASNRAVARIDAFSTEYHEMGRHLKNMGRAIQGKPAETDAKENGKIARVFKGAFKVEGALISSINRNAEWALNTLARLEQTAERRPSVLEAMREQAAKTEPAKKQPAPSHDKESR